jgi:hypothetical protein
VRGNGGPRRDVDRFEFRVGDSIAIFIPLGNGEKIRGLRANYLVVDETAKRKRESISSNYVEKAKSLKDIDRERKEGKDIGYGTNYKYSKK